MSKLIKYEFRNSKKPVMQIVFIMMIATLIIQISAFSSYRTLPYLSNLSEGSGDVVYNLLFIIVPLFIVVSVFVLFGASIMYYFRMANILKRDIYEDVGYITFSIPKNGYQIIGAKLVVAVIWTLVLPVVILVWNLLLASVLGLVFIPGEEYSKFLEFVFRYMPSQLLKIIKMADVGKFMTWVSGSFVNSILFILAMFASIIFDYNIGARRKGSLRWIIWLLILMLVYSAIKQVIFPSPYEFGGMFDIAYNDYASSFDFAFTGSYLMIFLDILVSLISAGLLFIYNANAFENKIEK